MAFGAEHDITEMVAIFKSGLSENEEEKELRQVASLSLGLGRTV